MHDTVRAQLAHRLLPGNEGKDGGDHEDADKDEAIAKGQEHRPLMQLGVRDGTRLVIRRDRPAPRVPRRDPVRVGG